MDSIQKFTSAKRPAVTVDIIIYTVHEEKLKILLVKRKYEPAKGEWVLPGGLVEMDESLDEAAKRELVEETGVKDVYLEQLYTFGEPNRDSRARVITVAYMALVNADNIKLNASTDAMEAKLFPIDKKPKLAFDHDKIFEYSLKRLRWKLEYTTVAFQLLPELFTLTELQKVYEIILEKKLDKRNFRKKLLGMGIVEGTNKKTENASHRPAQLFRFTKKIGEIVEII